MTVYGYNYIRHVSTPRPCFGNSFIPENLAKIKNEVRTKEKINRWNETGQRALTLWRWNYFFNFSTLCI